MTVRGCAREAVLRLQQQPQATLEEQPTWEQHWRAQAKAGVVKVGSAPHADVKRKIRALTGDAGDWYAVRLALGRGGAELKRRRCPLSTTERRIEISPRGIAHG